MEQTSRRPMTKARVAAILAASIIPTEGSNKLSIVGRGNPHTREDGTQVRIFNVQAFASQADALEAQKHFLEGVKLEASGDITGAQPHYKAALNKMMSFSVLERNASAFESTYQIIGKVELVDTREGGKRLGINNPRPVAVEASGSSVANLFELPAEAKEDTPETELSPEAKAALDKAGQSNERKPLGALPKQS